MIYVDRSRVAIPSILRGSIRQKELERGREFFSKPEYKGKQLRFRFEVYKHREVKQALIQLFHGKCAYCESKMEATQPGDIEHFRPKASVVESPDHPGYWWLASDWGNLLISCVDCGRTRIHEGIQSGKSNRFPLVDETERAFEPGDELNERPLLLNPCEDHPEEHLVFTEDGMVVSETPRGQTTIAVLGLNRKSLLSSRQRAARLTLMQIEEVQFLEKRLNEAPDDLELGEWYAQKLVDLERFTDAREEYAGLKRQLIRPVLEQILGTGSELEEITSSWDAPTLKISKARQRRAKRSYSAYQQAQADYSLRDEKGRQKYRLQRRFIERIEIHNVKAIRDLDVDLTTSQSGRTPWLMLLGENATGKSTVLQAVALALVGATYFKELVAARGIQPSKYIRNRCKSGYVKVRLSGFPQPHTLTFRETSVEFKSPVGKIATAKFEGPEIQIDGESWDPQFVLLGYGATRLLPHRDIESYGGDYARVDNLFDPFVPLVNARRWLLSLEPKQFDRTALVLKRLLALDDRDELIQEDGRIMLKAHRNKVPLEQLSDGYQTVVALTADILEVALRIWPKLEDAEGIVLLDEVGAHLHPTWKMRIVSSLRRTLPGVQFITTTHQPLCLRGLAEGEVVVMKRDQRKRIVPITALPDPRELRVDQLLTSPLFGLHSTYDPEEEQLFDEYYTLGALGEDNLTSDQQRRLEELRKRLKDQKHLGNSQREELMYTVIDNLLARERAKVTPTAMRVLKQEAVNRIGALWKEHLDFQSPVPDKEA